MSGYSRCNKGRKVITLLFKREELLYDCKNGAFIEGDVMEVNTEHDRHQVFDICEDGNVDCVTRVLDLAFAQCVELCYPYSKVAVANETILDDTLEYREVYEMKLLVPNDFSYTTVELLRRLIHELLVYKVMADWMSLTKPGSKGNWQEKIENTEQEITGMLNARIGRVRRTLTPF